MFEIMYASNKSFLHDLCETDPDKLLNNIKNLILSVFWNLIFLPWENLVQV